MIASGGEKNIARTADFIALADVSPLTFTDHASTHQVADGAARGRARGRVFSPIKLHPRAEALGAVLVLDGIWRQNIKPPAPALAQVSRGSVMVHLEARQRCG